MGYLYNLGEYIHLGFCDETLHQPWAAQILADPPSLVQHVSLGLGAVTAVTVAGVQQVTAEQLVCSLQKVDLVQHFVIVLAVLVYY